MAKDYMALIDPTGNPVPLVRQGTLVCLTPTVIPYGIANAARLAATCLPEVMSGIEEELGAWNCVECRTCMTVRLTTFVRLVP